MKFTELYMGKLISDKLNNGDWDYWFVIDITDMDLATGDISSGKYLLCLNAVSPKAAGKKNLREAFECCSVEYTKDKEKQVEVLNDYGCHASLFSSYGDDVEALKKQAETEAEKISTFFGFYMDRQQNRIGDTGWNFISGNIGWKK